MLFPRWVLEFRMCISTFWCSFLCHLMLLFLFFCLHCYCLPHPVGFHLVFVNLPFLLYESLCAFLCLLCMCMFPLCAFLSASLLYWLTMFSSYFCVFLFLCCSFVPIDYNLFVLLDWPFILILAYLFTNDRSFNMFYLLHSHPLQQFHIFFCL